VLLQSILAHRGASEGRALAVIDTITEVRQILGSYLIEEEDKTKLRDMLYLDLGLEAQVSHCNTLQHTATQLQHTATSRNCAICSMSISGLKLMCDGDTYVCMYNHIFAYIYLICT